jgi:hypothetical protein
MNNAFNYAKTYKVELGVDYPYVAKQNACKYNSTLGKVNV